MWQALTVCMCWRGLVNQTAVAEQSGGVGLGTTEALVEGHRFFAATHLEDVLAEAAACGLVEDAVLAEGFETVSIEHLGPQVAVVTYGIAATEDVVEVGATIAEGNLGKEANLVGYALLEGVGLKVGVVVEHVELHIEQGCTYELHGLET